MNSFLYRIEVDWPDVTRPASVFHERCKRCKTTRGANCQHERIVNLWVDRLRGSNFKRLTVSRVRCVSPVLFPL